MTATSEWINTEIWNKIVSPQGLDCPDAKEIKFPAGDSRHFTFFFNLFVCFQITNMIASRKIHDEWNIFEGFFENWVFLVVWGIIVGLQIIIVTFGGFVFEVIPLTWEQWLICAAISFTVFIIDALTKLIPDRFTYAVGKDTVFDKREIAAGRAPEAKFAEEK